MLWLGMPGAGAHLGPTSHSPHRHFPSEPVPWLDLSLCFLLWLQDASQRQPSGIFKNIKFITEHPGSRWHNRATQQKKSENVDLEFCRYLHHWGLPVHYLLVNLKYTSRNLKHGKRNKTSSPNGQLKSTKIWNKKPQCLGGGVDSLVLYLDVWQCLNRDNHH